MKRIDNWEQVEAFNGDKETLEPGGYICEIMEAKETTYYNNNGEAFQRLQVSFDIVEGPRAGHFARDYRTQAVYGKQKWNGVLRVFPPMEGSSDQAKLSQGRFKAITNALELSNPGYKWDWDETKLKGKRIGVMFRNEEWEYEGRHGWKVRPYRFVSAGYIERGEFEIPKDKPLGESKKSAPVTENDRFEEIPVPADDDLPFN